MPPGPEGGKDLPLYSLDDAEAGDARGRPGDARRGRAARPQEMGHPRVVEPRRVRGTPLRRPLAASARPPRHLARRQQPRGDLHARDARGHPRELPPRARRSGAGGATSGASPFFRIRPVGDRRLAAPERGLRPEDHVVRRGWRHARQGPEERPRLPSRDRARRKLGDGRRDAARPRADAGRRRPAGARPGRRGHAPEPEDAPRRRVDRHRLVHGHRVPGARGGRGGAGGCAPRRPRLSGGPGGRLLLRPPHAFSPLAGPPRPLLQVRDPPRLLPAQPRRLVLQRLGRSDRARTKRSLPRRMRAAS